MFGTPLLDSVTSVLVHFGQQSEIRKSEIAERLVGTRREAILYCAGINIELTVAYCRWK